MVENRKYVPDRCDIVWLDFNPNIGHEQAGKRPAVVITPKNYNEKTGLAIFCPITSKIKNYPFEVKLPSYCKIKGVILVDQIKSLDWKRRNAAFVFKLHEYILNEVIEKLKLLIF